MQPTITNCPHCGYLIQPQIQVCPSCTATLDSSVNSNLLRLNPFAFPRDTDFRLILLIISVLGANLFVFGNLYDSTSGRTNLVPFHCVLWMLGGSLLVIAVATAIYWFQPEWEIRKRDLQIMEDEDIPAGIKAYLTNLCKEVGIIHPPIFLWNPLTDDGGRAFGRIGRVYVYLSGALVRSFNDQHKRPAFRATVLHELAHIYNTDVHRTSLSIATFYAFLFVSLPAFFIGCFGSPLERIVKMTWRTLFLSLLIYLTWCSILRVREFYADVQASKFDGFSSTLSHILEAEDDPSKTLSKSQPENFLKQALHRVAPSHPNTRERSRILENPTPLMNMGFWTAFATGMAMMTAFFNMAALVMLFILSVVPARNLKEFGPLIFLIPALILAPVVIYIVGVGAWRITLTNIVFGKPIHGMGKLALGLTGGMFIGLQASFLAASKHMLPMIIVLPIILVLLCILAMFFSWMVLGASTWLPIAMASSSPRPFYRWGLAAAGLVFSSLLVNLCVTYIGSAKSTPPHLIMAASPLTTLSLVCLWGFPLAAWFWRRKVRQDTSVSSWLFIDELPQSIRLPRQLHLQPSLALAIGLIIGIVGSLTLLILLPGAKSIGWNSFNFVVGGSIGIQIIAAVAMTIYVRNLSSLHGLLGTFVAGCVLAVGALSIMLTAGMIDAKDLLFIALIIVNSGSFLALPIILIMSVVARLLRCATPQMA